jgi:signal transduction histidine kinase
LILWSLANFASMALCWGLIVLADRYIFCHRKESWLWGILLFSAFIGATKGGTTTVFGALLGVESDFQNLIGGRLIQTALLGLVTIPALAILATTRAKYQDLRDALVAERVRVASNDPILNTISSAEYARLADEIGKAREGIKTTSNIEVSALIRDIVQNGLRPLTHRLWDREDQKQTNFTLRDLSRVAILGHPFVAWPVALILFIGTLGPYVYAAGWGQGILRSLFTAVAILVFYQLAKLFKSETVLVAWGYYISVHIGLAGLIVLGSQKLFGELPGFTPLSAFCVLFIWILQTGYMTSFIAGAVATHNEMRLQLQVLSQTLGLDRQVMLARAHLAKRDIANYLHSDLQNKLLSLALRIESGESNADFVGAELEAIQQLLRGGDQPETSNLRPLDEQLGDLLDRWKGFVMIHVSGDYDVVDKTLAKQVVLVVAEGISNAVRHGLASEVFISLKQSGSKSVIELLDDGIGPRSGVPGLGSRFFDSIAGTNWSLSPRPEGGSALVVEV